jgi:hypothetical protein
VKWPVVASGSHQAAADDNKGGIDRYGEASRRKTEDARLKSKISQASGSPSLGEPRSPERRCLSSSGAIESP